MAAGIDPLAYRLNHPPRCGTNFHQCPLVTLADTPAINTHFEALSGHQRVAIIGEAAIGPVGPAVGNAICQATGERLRSTRLPQARFELGISYNTHPEGEISLKGYSFWQVNYV